MESLPILILSPQKETRGCAVPFEKGVGMKLLQYLTKEEKKEYEAYKKGSESTNVEAVLSSAMIRLLDADFSFKPLSHIKTKEMEAYYKELE